MANEPKEPHERYQIREGYAQLLRRVETEIRSAQYLAQVLEDIQVAMIAAEGNRLGVDPTTHGYDVAETAFILTPQEGEPE